MLLLSISKGAFFSCSKEIFHFLNNENKVMHLFSLSLPHVSLSKGENHDLNYVIHTLVSAIQNTETSVKVF